MLDAGTWRVYNLLSDNTTPQKLVQRLKIGQAPLTLFDSYRIRIEIYMVYFQNDRIDAQNNPISLKGYLQKFWKSPNK